uniref:Uncharacterized protein n=1 Tax=Daphnia galeata TaxID=27404 RepID=A0A8J2RQ59_9CRUS|nr:unnamed protein product [Daphnia galeata]
MQNISPIDNYSITPLFKLPFLFQCPRSFAVRYYFKIRLFSFNFLNGSTTLQQIS